MNNYIVSRKYLQLQLKAFSGLNDVSSRRGGVYPHPRTCADTVLGGDKPRQYFGYRAVNEYTCRRVIKSSFLQLLCGHNTRFLFRTALLFLAFVFTAVAADARIIAKTIPYQSEGMKLKGYLAYDDAKTEKRPGVLVVHEWWGLTDDIRKRVDQLASMGYVAFALDLYGMGKTTTDMTKATKMLRMVQMNGYRWAQRGLAGLKVLMNLPQVDSQRIAAIGYGWGGATLQQLVFKGTDIKGAVLFGSFTPPSADQVKRVKATILVLQGSADPYLDPNELTDYIGAMDKSGLDWQMVLFGGAKQGFSDPNAAQYKMKEFAYNQAADRRSWKQVELFLSELFQIADPKIDK